MQRARRPTPRMRAPRPASRSGRSTARSSPSRTCSTSPASRRARARRFSPKGTPAKADAPVVRRLRAAGAVIVAKTNMSEFAFSGVGMNPHYGTPGNPADRARVPGGSSSGAAVAVADGMCEIAIGTDTGGSTPHSGARSAASSASSRASSACRPTVRSRSPTSLDSIGPMARTVADCARGRRGDGGRGAMRRLTPAPLAGLRLGVPQGFLLTEWDNTVGTRFGARAGKLADAGVRDHRRADAAVRRDAAGQRQGRLRAGRGLFDSSRQLAKRPGDFDPNVRVRIERGGKLSGRRLRRDVARAHAADRARWTRSSPISTRW